MTLTFHAGVHFTEEGRLLKSLQRNRDDWASRGIAVPDPDQYRKPLRRRLVAPPKVETIAGLDDDLLDQILQGASADRVIMSNANLFGVPKAALRRGALYPKAPQRVADLARLFEANDIRLFMALRNPATFLPCCFEKSPRDTMRDFLSGADPRLIRWSDTLSAMRAAAPRVPITVWCNEDAVFLWSRIMREMAGLEAGDAIKGRFDLLISIMSDEGARRFAEYLKTDDARDEAQQQEAAEAFLRDFARDDAVREVIDLPGWTEDLIADMTAEYHKDIQRLSHIPGVTVMTP